MNRIIRGFATLAVALSAAAGLSACGGGGGIPSNDVALVGSTPITKAELNHWMAISAAAAAAPGSKVLPPVPVPPNYTACVAYLRANEPQPVAPKTRAPTTQLKAQCAKDYAQDKEAALTFLIPADWALGESKEIGVKVRPNEIAKLFAATKKEHFPTEAKYKQYRAHSAYDTADLELKLEIEKMLPPRTEAALIARAQRAVTKSVIEHYYNSHRSTYEKTEGAGLYILLTQTEAQAKAAKAAIESGQSFASVAMRDSILHTSQKHGVYLTTEKGLQEPALDAAIYPATKHVNELIGPLKTTDGYYLFEVKTTTPAHQESLSQARERIAQMLTLKRSEKELSTFHSTYGKRWHEKTTCLAEYYVSSLCGKKQ